MKPKLILPDSITAPVEERREERKTPQQIPFTKIWYTQHDRGEFVHYVFEHPHMVRVEADNSAVEILPAVMSMNGQIIGLPKIRMDARVNGALIYVLRDAEQEHADYRRAFLEAREVIEEVKGVIDGSDD